MRKNKIYAFNRALKNEKSLKTISRKVSTPIEKIMKAKNLWEAYKIAKAHAPLAYSGNIISGREASKRCHNMVSHTTLRKQQEKGVFDTPPKVGFYVEEIDLFSRLFQAIKFHEEMQDIQEVIIDNNRVLIAFKPDLSVYEIKPSDQKLKSLKLIHQWLNTNTTAKALLDAIDVSDVDLADIT